MTCAITSFGLGIVMALVSLIAIAVWIELRDRKHKRRQAMDAACNELERGAR